MKSSNQEFQKLIDIMDILRGPDGCPWDAKQTPQTLKRYILEESYEVVDAVESGETDNILEELGDLLFQIVFMAKLFAEKKAFNMNDVINAIADKMIRRHPHIFGDTTVKDADQVKENWEKIKAAEKKNAASTSIIDKVPRFIPPLERARLLTETVAKVGFDWSATSEIVEKIEEELNELKEVLKSDEQEKISSEIGDLFMAIVNLARFLKIDPDESLRGTIKRFIFRFHHIEKSLAGQDLKDVPVDEMEKFWQEAKQYETKA